MELPSCLSSILVKEKKVFYFVSEQINKVPHNFVVLKNIDNSLLFFSCCTSQYDTVYKYVMRNGYDEKTIAHLDYKTHSFLTKPTFINCNSKVEYSYNDFMSLYNKGRIKYKGEVNDDEYERIVEGILLSEEIEEDFKNYLR
ncbi:hypothetical protein [Wenyingzhuangia sp. IMCC45574]